MDLSGAFTGSMPIIYSDCSGENLVNHGNSNIPHSMPAHVEECEQVNPEERDLDLFRRYVGNRNSGDGVRSRTQQHGGNTIETHEDDVSPTSEPVAPAQPWIRRETILYYSIHVVNLLWSVVSTTYSVSRKIVRSVYDGFQPSHYYFFHDSPVPYDARKVNLQSAGVPRVEWTYDADSRVFKREENDGSQHHFPYLTAQIYHGDLALYDITPFAESVVWTGGSTPPSANHLLAAWYLESGILLDPSLPLTLVAFNEDGDTVRIPLHETTSPANASTT